ncbi:proteoglycan Cow [Folsomia candida]|uniref:proteoglycan Cow n=1 Tax=Folsomia candida TaxID=158441 RepID=UPI000B8F0BB3|nr:proteoglycan Cow [Folsomia candida]
MEWKSGVIFILFVVTFLLINTAVVEAKKKQHKFDGDFEFADEEETKTNRKEGKKTWILDPGSDLCQALKCKKKELCLLEDEFTAVCVSKKELHKNGDIIVPKSKLKETPTPPKLEDEEKEQYEEEDDDSDYYDEDEDSNEDFFSSGKTKSDKNSKSSSSSSSSNTFNNNNGAGGDNSFKSCTPCPVVKPTFLCGSDNRTYSSLCRLDYHNCIQNSQVSVGCKGFCPCKNLDTFPHGDYKYNMLKQRMAKSSKVYQPKALPFTAYSASGKKSKSVNPPPPIQIGLGQSSTDDKDNNVFSKNDFASGTPVATSISKDRYSKYKDYYGYKSPKLVDKQRSHNDVINIKPASTRDCNDEALESMGNRLLDWFSVVMADTQKRKLNRRNRNSQVHFPGTCKREVMWMFSHLNSDDDGQLSLQELFDIENDRNEKCIKPFLDRCDADKDVFISPREWCECFTKACRGVNCGLYSDRDDNELDDDDDSDIDGSSGDGALE